MNNSWVKLEMEEKFDRTPLLKEREGELLTLIEALQEVQKSRPWSTLKSKVFESLAATLTKELNAEARKETPDVLHLRFIAGQLRWAERFSDLKKLEDAYRIELSNIRKLYGTTEKPGSNG